MGCCYHLADIGAHPNPSKAVDPGSEAPPPARARPDRGTDRATHLRPLPRRRRAAPHRHRPHTRRHPLAIGARPQPQLAPRRQSGRVGEVSGARHPRQPALHRPPGVEQAAPRRGARGRRRRRPRPRVEDALERQEPVGVVRAARPRSARRHRDIRSGAIAVRANHPHRSEDSIAGSPLPALRNHALRAVRPTDAGSVEPRQGAHWSSRTRSARSSPGSPRSRRNGEVSKPISAGPSRAAR